MTDMSPSLHTHGWLPRVRFAVDVQPDESLPGIVARAAREHVLPDIRAMLRGTKVDLYNPGVVLSVEASQIPQLAYMLRLNRSLLKGRAATKDGKALRFGNLTLPLGTIDTRLRWIGPRSLLKSPHHRFAWMNRLLPCCPETGEFLVSQCPACTRPLRWYRTWGIGTCENCRCVVPPSPLPPIKGRQLELYRLMSRIMSFDAAIRSKALTKLPKRIKGYAPGTLAIASIQMAGLLKGRDGLGGDLKSVRGLAPLQLAELVSAAGALLEVWPYGLRGSFRRKVERFGNDHDQFFLTWRALKRFSSDKLTDPEKAALILDGIPDLKSSIWNSFTSERRTYSTFEAMQVLGIDNGRVQKLARCADALEIRKPSKGRENRHYVADLIDSLRATKDASTTFASITASTGIPNYGVEQLAASGQLEVRDGEAFSIAYPRPFVSSESFRHLKAAIEKKRKRTKPPVDARPLSECARLLGGGEKPWSQLIAALANGDISHWGKRDCLDIRTILVRPCDVKPFVGLRFNVSKFEFPFSSTFAKREAAEVLTIDTPQLDASLVALRLDFEKRGRALEIGRSRIIEVAEDIISNAEIAEHWGIAAKSVRHDKRMSGISRIAYGWKRSDMIAAGLISNSR